MLISFPCEKCGTTLQADSAMVGSVVACPQCSQSLAVPAAEIKTGTTIGGFEIERLLGKGGMGEVYLARQLSMDRLVALKILPPRMRMDRDSADRFLREVRVLASLEHPNIVAAYEAGEDAGVLFLAMAYVDGQSLEDRIRQQGRLGWKEACGLTRKLAAALAYAWGEHQLLHRDIKPANVLLDSRGEPRLVDMGLAKSTVVHDGLTLSSTTMGTPNYMSPEQIEAREDLDFRTDMYALGATLWHMLTGKKPFQGSSLMDTLRKQTTEPLADPREHAPDVPEGVVTLLEVMLAKDRDHRHESWSAFSSDLQRVLSGRPPQRRPPASGDSTLIRGVARQRLAARSVPAPAAAAPAAKHVPAPAARRSAVPWVVAAGFVLVLGIALVFSLRGKSRHATGPAQGTESGSQRTVMPVPLQKTDETHTAPTTESADVAEARAAAELAAIQSHEKQNPSAYAELVARYGALARDRAGTRSSGQANRELERVRAAKRDAVNRAMAALRSTIEGHAGAGQFVAAERAAADYAGPFAADTVSERQELVRWVKERAETQRREAEKAAEEAAARLAEARDKVVDVFDDAAADVLRQDLAGATAKLRNAGMDAGNARFSKELAAASQFVQALGTIGETVLKSFAAQIGQTVQIESRIGLTETCVVAGADGGKVRVRRSAGASWVERELTVADLSLREKQRRLEGRTPDVVAMRGLLALESKDLAGAQALFDEAAAAEAAAGRPGTTDGPVLGMASALARVTLRMTAEGREKTARQALDVLVQLAGVTAPSGGTLVDAVSQKEYTESQVKRLRAAVAGFRKQHGESVTAKDNAALLDALAAVDVGPSGIVKIDLGEGVTLEMVWVKPGKFLMGSPANEPGRQPFDLDETQHEVTLTKGFWMGKYEVTQGQWEHVMGNNPSKFKGMGRDAPVENVSWDDCQEFLRKLNEKVTASAGMTAEVSAGKFRLPTEAEWEYACRAGSKTAYCFGDNPADLHRHGNFREKASGLPVGGAQYEKTDLEHDDGFRNTAPVGKYRPNAWGLHDMHGNVGEWCRDLTTRYPASAVTDPVGQDSGNRSSSRGGHWLSGATICRSAFRWGGSARNYRDGTVGLRLARSERTSPNSVFDPSDLLTDKFSDGELSGYRGRDQPFTLPGVLANPTASPTSRFGGNMRIPPRTVCVHPATRQDVAIGWLSSVGGTVNLKVKVTHGHLKSDSDGVSVRLLHQTRVGEKLLAEGLVDQGGSLALPIDKDATRLTAVTVAQGDGLLLVIGKRRTVSSDTSFVEWTITEVGGAKRVWDLATDVAGDIQAGNPHADSRGQPNVWHFLGPPASLDQPKPTEGGKDANTMGGRTLEEWQSEVEGRARRLGIRYQKISVSTDGLWVDLDSSNTTDLRFLSDAPVTAIRLANTRVADLSPLAGKRLRKCFARGSAVRDLSALKGMTTLAELNYPDEADPLENLLAVSRGKPAATVRVALADFIRDWKDVPAMAPRVTKASAMLGDIAAGRPLAVR